MCLNYRKQKFVSTKKNSNSSATTKKWGNYICTHCKISGYDVERCFKIHGYPPQFKGYKDRKVNAAVSSNNPNIAPVHSKSESPSIFIAQYQQLMDLLNKQTVSCSSQKSHNHPEHAMLIDSSATNHIYANHSLFLSYKQVVGKYEYIVVPDDKQIPILHIGSIIFIII